MFFLDSFTNGKNILWYPFWYSGAKPFVKGMHKSKIIKAIGAHIAKHRTQHLKHVMFNSKSSLLGKIYNKILEPICYFVGKHG